MPDVFSESDVVTDPEPQAAELPEDEELYMHPSLSDNLLFNLVLPLVLLTLGVAVILLLGKAKPESRPAADISREGQLRALPPVRVEQLRAHESALELVVDGNVVPYREALVAAEVAGQIVFKEDYCEAGQFVTKGQRLMRIDDTDYKLEVERLESLEDQAQQALKELEQEELNLNASIAKAAEDVKLQIADVARKEKLGKEYGSRGEIDQAKRALVQAEQQKLNYENQLKLVAQRRLSLEASERLAATQLEAARVNESRCEIRAPISGVIVTENADLNTFVARGNLLVTIEDISKVEVRTNLRVDQLYWIMDQEDPSMSDDDSAASGYRLPPTDAIIEYELAGMEHAYYRWQGKLMGYDGIGLDATSRTAPVRVIVDQPRRFQDERGSVVDSRGPSALVRGMFVRVKFLIKPRTPLVVIPARALKPGNRVWQFVRDETVLDKAIAKAKEKLKAEAEENGQALDQDANDKVSSEKKVANDKVADDKSGEDGKTGDADAKPEFDAKQWAAGRVVVRDAIIPVDSLRAPLADKQQSRNTSMNSGSAAEDRMWVCEVRDRSLKGGSFVVISPLASVDNDDMPARAKVEDMKSLPQEKVASIKQKQASAEGN